MELTITQKKVLKVLYESRNIDLKDREISKRSGVPMNHVKQALIKFIKNDYVYQPTIDGEFMISADGESAYLDSI